MKEDCEDIIRSYTRHQHILFTQRANKSILLAMKVAMAMHPGKTSIIIPDQGGWLTYKQSPKKVKLTIDEVKTDYGVLDITDLKRLSAIGNSAALIYSNPAGYYADQPIKEIHEACEGNLAIILDASGCLGDKGMCDGRYADIAVGSFGKWKPVNVGKGGFISFRSKEAYELALSFYEDDHGLTEKDFADLHQRLLLATSRIDEMKAIATKAKQDLSSYEVLHPGRIGINVVVKFKNGKDKEEIIAYCQREGLEYTECPKYIRVNENAISIEIKRR